MTMWATCEEMGTTWGSSTCTQVSRVQHVHTHHISYTCSFQQLQVFEARRPQSTAPINTITSIHHLTAPVIASSYTGSNNTKVQS